MAARTVHGRKVPESQRPLPGCRWGRARKANVNGSTGLAPEKTPYAHDREKREERGRARQRTETAIRRFCLECQGKTALRVLECRDVGCPLYALRLGPGKRRDSAPEEKSEANAKPVHEEHPARAVRRYCMNCCGGLRREVRACEAGASCALWLFRHGVTPEKRKQGMLRFFSWKQLWLPGVHP